jgi:hypothetical protein
MNSRRCMAARKVDAWTLASFQSKRWAEVTVASAIDCSSRPGLMSASGQKTEVCRLARHVSSTLDNRHRQAARAGPFIAIRVDFAMSAACPAQR